MASASRQTRAVAEFLTALEDDDGDADRKLPKVISPSPTYSDSVAAGSRPSASALGGPASAAPRTLPFLPRAVTRAHGLPVAYARQLRAGWPGAGVRPFS